MIRKFSWTRCAKEFGIAPIFLIRRLLSMALS